MELKITFINYKCGFICEGGGIKYHTVEMYDNICCITRTKF